MQSDRINLQLNIVGVVGCRASFFRKNVLENKKTTPRRSKQKGGSQK
jgi:hypothetical protein